MKFGYIEYHPSQIYTIRTYGKRPDGTWVEADRLDDIVMRHGEGEVPHPDFIATARVETSDVRPGDFVYHRNAASILTEPTPP